MKYFLFALLLPFTLLSQPLQVSDTLRFLALGDSYTIGQSVAVNARWPVQLSDSLASRGVSTETLRIIATTGWRTDDLLNAITGQQLQQQHYNLVSLLIGVNNQYQNRPFSQYITEFPALLDSAIRYAGGNTHRVFVVSIPDYAYTPYGQSTSNPSQITTELAHYNQYNKRVADSLGVHYFDITPISQQGVQHPSYVAADGLHPSGEQYAQWVKLMLDFIYSVIPGFPVQSQNDLHVSLWPNPANGQLVVGIGDSRSVNGTVQLYGSTGQLVMQQAFNEQVFSLHVQDLAAGLYTVRISSGNNFTVRKFFKTNN